MESRYLFIDGAYLREVVKNLSGRYFPGELIEIDFGKLTNGFRKTFYYDCLPGSQADESSDAYQARTASQETFFNGLRLVPGMHVNEGSVRGEGGRRRQKKIDTMMAVDMLTHSYRKNASAFALVAGDLDFKPVVDALVQDGMYVTLWYEKQTASQELIFSVDSREPIDIQRLFSWSKEAFRRSHSLPHAFVQGGDDAIKGFTLMKRGKMEDSLPIELYQNTEGTLCFVFADTGNLGAKVFVQHNDRNTICKYVEDIWQPFQLE